MHSISKKFSKKKVFFMLASLSSGGSERVFWSIAQGLDKEKYDVTIVILNSKSNCYSTDLDKVRIIDLNTLKASKSFFALYKLLKKEKPNVVFSTTDHINMLISLVARFVKGPKYIARVSNTPSEQILFDDLKTRFYALFSKLNYQVFDKIICQTDRMKQAVLKDYETEPSNTVVIHNPVLKTELLKVNARDIKKIKLLIVARFSPEKGLDRMIDVFANLPSHYELSMVGVGRLKEDIMKKVDEFNLNDRVKFYGQINNVKEVMIEHDLVVLSSHTEGFPNVLIEALSVGLPIVTFQVSGSKELIVDGFNGFVVPQNDLLGFKEKIIQATSKVWDHVEIKREVYRKFDLENISKSYEKLIN